MLQKLSGDKLDRREDYNLNDSNFSSKCSAESWAEPDLLCDLKFEQRGSLDLPGRDHW
jgi:hypothetical protein